MRPQCSLIPPPPTALWRPTTATSLPPPHFPTRRRRQPHVASAASAAAALTRQHKVLNFLAGGLAGALSSFFTTPLEVLRTRVQASDAGRVGRSVASVAGTIARTDGLRGFYRGLGMSLIGALPMRSIYFATYQRTKQKLRELFGRDGAVVHLLSAVAAGSTANFIMSPLWVVRTRMQLGNTARYKGYADACGRMLREEGVGAFYRGFSASLWGTSEAAIHFVLYEKLKSWQGEMTPVRYMLTAGVSKLVASLSTYPHERVRVLMREIPKEGCKPKYRGMVQSLKLIVREEGVGGLYRGVGCHLMRTVPNTAIMFLCYEVVRGGLERRHRRKMRELMDK